MIDTHAQNLTPWDPTSIMLNADCRTSAAPNPSFWDIYGMQKLYGARGPLNQIITSYKSSTGDYTAGNSPPSGYVASYPEGWVWARSMPGTAPLDLYFHSGRGDYWALATSASRQAAEFSGYVRQSTIGHIYTSPQPGTVEIKRYRHPVTGHNFTTASPAGAAVAQASGYTLMWVEGYVFPASDHPLATDGGVPFQTLTYYWRSASNNSVLTRTGGAWALVREANGYQHLGLDGMTLKHNVQGTTALRQFYSSDRTDDFATATATGASDALAAGYVEQMPHEGYVFTTSVNDTTALKLYWKSSILDNFTTAERTAGSGYVFVRNEGFAMLAQW